MAAEQPPRGAGMGAYLKEAFLFRWNLLFLLGGTAAAAIRPPASLASMLAWLTPDARARFERLHARCNEMRRIAAGVGGAAGDQSSGAEEIRTPGLDRLLWLFLRLLLSKAALDRFLATIDDKEISTRLPRLRKNLPAAQSGGGRPLLPP